MNAFESMVYDTALESVGSFENGILDGMGEKGTMTRDKMMLSRVASAWNLRLASLKSITTA